MVWDLLLGSMLSSVAGLTLALLTALLTDHREKRRWLERKIHQPMYSELTDVISGETPWEENDYVSRWADLDYYKTYRVDVGLAETLDRYSSEISELAGCEHAIDHAAFVRALPEGICDDEGLAELPSGRSIEMVTWLRRNALVLSTDHAVRTTPLGFEPADLDYLWAEVDGVSVQGEDSVETDHALEAVSTEFNWGYEGFYRHWPDGWADELVAAFIEAAGFHDDSVQELLSRRRAVGKAASEAKALIEARAEWGLLKSLFHKWVA